MLIIVNHYNYATLSIGHQSIEAIEGEKSSSQKASAMKYEQRATPK